MHDTLPVSDYHGYLLHFETALGESLPGLHMEDLSEVALSHEVARRAGAVIPCAVCVLDLPDPYYVREEAATADQATVLHVKLGVR